MKYLIVGLGNPGAEYADTRHNVGFRVAEELAAAADVSFTSEHLGSIAEFKHKSRIFVLLKPNTYMNLSGKAVRYWLQKKAIPQENLLVITDDLNLNFGKMRMRPSGSDGGHNGLKSITEVLGNNNFVRLRIGIGAEFSKGRQIDYVLGEWNAQESEALPEILKRGAEAVKSFGTIGINMTMTQFNK